MTLEQALVELEALGSEKVRAYAYRQGGEASWYGVKLGDIRVLAKRLGANQALADELWDTGNGDARLLAILLLKPKTLSPERVDQLVRETASAQVSDWVTAYIVRPHPAREELRTRWMADAHPMAARVGWALTADRVSSGADGLDLDALLDRIETEALATDPLVQWTMNGALAQIGIHSPERRARALAIGERLGMFRDYPTPKGCTSPFAPIWIAEMVRRREGG